MRSDEFVDKKYREAGVESGVAAFSAYPRVSFARQKEGRVVATMSLLLDEGSLPADQVFPQETQHFRELPGSKVAQVAMMAGEGGAMASGFMVLARQLVQHAAGIGVTHLLAVMHPGRASVYRRICFRQMGEEQMWVELGDQGRVVFLYLDLAWAEGNHPNIWAKFFGGAA